MRIIRFFVLFTAAFCWAYAAAPENWIPAFWEGGPLEVARRAQDKTLADPAVREAIAGWYDPATLGLLEGSGVNCLLVSFSAGLAPEVEQRQQQLVKEYGRAARERGIAVLGMVYKGADASKVAAAAAEAGLDGLVIEAAFPEAAAFALQLEAALATAKSTALVIPIAQKPALLRTAKAPLIAVEGVAPSSKNLADMGIRGGPSTEPWLESNIWLVRSFRLGAAWRPVWVSNPPEGNSPGDYIRCVADAAVAGGRWIVMLDDPLRAGLLHKDAGALATWHAIGSYLKFAEEHAEWRSFQPYGTIAIILDTAAAAPDAYEEYLHLTMRKQIPYRLIPRSELSAQSLAGLRAVVAAELAPPTAAERKVLQSFAGQGGLVLAGPSWGNPPGEMPYAELPLGKGRVAVYKDEPPEADSVGRDLKDLLPPQDIGVSTFNVPSSITYASTPDPGKRVLVQLLNYSSYPAAMITVRVNGDFKTARLFTPGGPPSELAVRKATGNRTEISLPKLAAWGAVLFE